MFETTITLKPESQWRPGMTTEKLIAPMDSAVRMPGVTNAWTMPIKGRIDMLATGIRTPVGVKIFGPDLAELERLGREVERAVQMVPGTRSAFAERAVSGYYLDIDIDRAAAARHGLNVGDVQTVIATAIGGMTVTQTVEGRERYGVRVRYPAGAAGHSASGWLDVLIPVPTAPPAARPEPPADGHGGREPPRAARAPAAYVPLGQVATIRAGRRPDGRPHRGRACRRPGCTWTSPAATSAATSPRRSAWWTAMVRLPPGYTLVVERPVRVHAARRGPAAGGRARHAGDHLPAAVPQFPERGGGRDRDAVAPLRAGGRDLVLWLLGYNWSVAVAVGFIALAGVAAETGVVMLIYLDQAWAARRAAGRPHAPRTSTRPIIEGAVERVRPKMMTVTAIMAGLLPILWGSGAGASVMKRIAAPMVGGMVSSTC